MLRSVLSLLALAAVVHAQSQCQLVFVGVQGQSVVVATRLASGGQSLGSHSFSVSGAAKGLALVDVTGDHLPDVALSSSEEVVWMENKGNGSLVNRGQVMNVTQDPSLQAGRPIVGIPVADGALFVASSGRPVFDQGTQQWLRVVAANGSALTLQRSDITYGGASTTTLGDVDGDGLPDLIETGSSPNPYVAWQRNLGGNLFGAQTLVATTSSLQPVAFIGPDISATGHGDIFTPAGHYARLDNTFGPLQADYGAVAACDLNNDGFVDLIQVNATGLSWIPCFSNRSVGTPTIIIADSSVSQVGVFCVDYDQDGDNDIVFRRTKTVEWVRNAGSGTAFTEMGLLFNGYNASTDFLSLGYSNCCSPGQSSSPFGVNCSVCGAGRFSYQHSAPSCTDCPRGRFSEVPASTVCSVCPAGTASNTTGAVSAASCAICGAGTFSQAASAICEPCAAGFSNPVVNSSECSPCPQGTSSVVGSFACDDCIPGKFAANSTQGECTTCPGGYACPLNRTVSPIPCDPGYQCPPGSVNKTALLCRAGTFCGNLSSEESPCPGGFYCVAGTQAPVPCGVGAVCPINSSSPQPCDAGFFCPAQSSTPSTCPAGQYCIANATNPLPCPGGSVCAENASSPSVCSASTFCPPNVSSARTCPAGYFCASNSSSPSMCPEGSYCPRGSGSPSPCPDGATCDSGIACPAGYVCTGSNPEASACPAGQYCPVNSTSSGLQCPGGSYCPAGSAVSTPCGAGVVCPPGSSVPRNCSGGTICPPGSSSELPCPSGTYCRPASAVGINCSTCAPGQIEQSACNSTADTVCATAPATGSSGGNGGIMFVVAGLIGGVLVLATIMCCFRRYRRRNAGVVTEGPRTGNLDQTDSVRLDKVSGGSSDVLVSGGSSSALMAGGSAASLTTEHVVVNVHDAPQYSPDATQAVDLDEHDQPSTQLPDAGHADPDVESAESTNSSRAHAVPVLVQSKKSHKTKKSPKKKASTKASKRGAKKQGAGKVKAAKKGRRGKRRKQ